MTDVVISRVFKEQNKWDNHDVYEVCFVWSQDFLGPTLC